MLQYSVAIAHVPIDRCRAMVLRQNFIETNSQHARLRWQQ
jgi:hypothetical protein